MPRISVWAVRISLVYLVGGFTFGALLLSNKAFLYWAAVWMFLPVHVEMLVTGWMIQFVLGIAYWIFPRFQGGVRGNEKIAWLAILLFNAGLIFSISALLLSSSPGLWAGRALEAAGVLLLLSSLWSRVKPLPGQK